MWSYFFGRGIVDPVDDFRSTNPPTHPELLQALAKDFRDSGYDLKHLMRTIVQSRTYQLSGTPNETNKDDKIDYSHAQPRPLEAAVLLDAITSVTGVPEKFQFHPLQPAGRIPAWARGPCRRCLTFALRSSWMSSAGRCGKLCLQGLRSRTCSRRCTCWPAQPTQQDLSAGREVGSPAEERRFRRADHRRVLLGGFDAFSDFTRKKQNCWNSWRSGPARRQETLARLMWAVHQLAASLRTTIRGEWAMKNTECYHCRQAALARRDFLTGGNVEFSGHQPE